MIQVAPSAAPVATLPLPSLTAPASVAASPTAHLPEPTMSSSSPEDLIGMVMALMTEMTQTTTERTEARVTKTQAEIKEQLDKLLDQIKQAAEQAKNQDDGGGLFGGLFKFVGEALGAVAGSVVDFTADAVTMPFDVTAAVAQGKDFLATLKAESAELTKNGAAAESVKGFTKGAVKFAQTVVECAVKVGVALAEFAETGKSPMAALEEQGKRLWDSLNANILSNPTFLEVVGWYAKAAAATLAVVSAGALAPVLVAAIVVTELDNRYGASEKIFGKEAAPWVKLGLNLAVAASMPFIGGEAAGNAIRGCAAVMQGGSAAAQGARTIAEGNRQADELERSADMQSTLNRMQQLQRMVDDLIGDLEEESDRSNQNMSAGTEASQTQAATYQAAIMKA